MPRRATEAELWDRYRADGSARAVNDLIRHYRPMVTDVVRSTPAPSNIDRAELEAAGTEGLWTAITGWDPALGPFPARAKFCIARAIQDWLRSTDRLSRTDRTAKSQLVREEDRLTQKLGRAPTDAELAGAMRCSVQHVHNTRLWALATTYGSPALNTERSYEWETQPTDDADPEELAVYRDFSRSVADALSSIDGRHGIVLRLYYLEQLSMPEIGELLGIKAPMVSRLHTQAIKRLHAKLG